MNPPRLTIFAGLKGSITMVKKLNLAVIVLNVILILAGVAASVYLIAMPDVSWLQRIFSVIDIFLLAVSFCYMVYGYQKKSALFYKLFTYLFSLRLFLAAISVDANVLAVPDMNVPTSGFPIRILLAMIPYTAIFLVAFGRDLGKKKSYVFCGVAFFSLLLIFALTLIVTPGQLRNGTVIGTAYVIKSGILVLLASLEGLMTVGKYTDKANRNTN